MSDLHNTFTPEAPHESRPVVLVVEDHDDTREMLELLLSSFGCQVISAANGQQALDAAETTHPDLILMDLRIPVLDGLTVTRLIRANPSLNKVPIVAVTGWDTPQNHAAALDAGCNQCLAKPIDFDHLETVVKSLTRSAPRVQYALAAR